MEYGNREVIGVDNTVTEMIHAIESGENWRIVEKIFKGK